MSYIRKSRNDNAKWVCDVTVDGKRKSRTFKLKSDAVRWGYEQEEKGVFTGHTLYQAIEEYRPQALASANPYCENNKLDVIKRNIANYKLDEIDETVIIAYRNDRLKAAKPATVNKEMFVLSSVFKHCIKELKWMHTNPCATVDKPKKPPPRARGISNEEISAVIAKLDGATITGDQLKCLFLLGIETAMRLSEMLNLTWDRVFPKYVHLEKTKNGDSRNVPLSSKARALIDSRRGLDPVRVFTMSQACVSQAFCRYKVNDIHFHDTRSEGITRLSKKLDILDLARAIGHRDVSSLLFYYKSDADSLSDKLG